MRILISTGIYPPKIGGPAQYAKNLGESFKKLGHEVSVVTYTKEDSMPTGIRHIYFFFKILSKVKSSDVVYVLDTFSVGLPTVLACTLLQKKCIIRTGGDFLWEQYVERTGKKVLLRDFYQTEEEHFSFKDIIIFRLTKWTLLNASKVIFSTAWQRDIFVKAYDLDLSGTVIVENYYGSKESDMDFQSQVFIGSVRNLVWKNLDILKRAFNNANATHPIATLFIENLPFHQFMQKIQSCYAVVLVSLGDISPNMILDAIRFNRPFICTTEVGIYERIKDVGIFVDPLNEVEIENAILKLLDPIEYQKAKGKVQHFNFVHTWDEITEEFIRVFKGL